jgi:hypothetical protein
VLHFRVETALALLSGLSLGISIGILSLLIAIGALPFLSIFLFAIATVLAIMVNYMVWSDEADACFAVGGAIGVSLTRLVASKSMNQFMERLFLFVLGGVLGAQLSKVKQCFS